MRYDVGYRGLKGHCSGPMGLVGPSLYSHKAMAGLNPDSPSLQIYFKTPSGELQTVLLQEAPAMTVAPSVTTCSSPVSRSSQTGGSSKKTATRKERTLPKIAPAGGIISLNAAQLAAAAQAMQTININGVQVQGVPVTITNTGGGYWGSDWELDGNGRDGTNGVRRALMFWSGQDSKPCVS